MKILAGKSPGTTALGRTKSRLEYNIKMDLEK
jgi:hypothetical protein